MLSDFVRQLVIYEWWCYEPRWYISMGWVSYMLILWRKKVTDFGKDSLISIVIFAVVLSLMIFKHFSR